MLYGNKRDKLDKILTQATADAKGDYRVYHDYRRRLEELELDPKTFEQSVRKLAKILRV